VAIGAFLRLLLPEKLCLSAEALEYLKTVATKSRVVVKRTAYDSPPIKGRRKAIAGNLEKLDAQIREGKLLKEKADAPLAAAVLHASKSSLDAFRSIEVQRLGSSNGLSECTIQGFGLGLSCFIFGNWKREF